MEQPRPDLPPPATPSGRKSALAFFGVVLLLFLPGILAQATFRPAGLVWSEVFAFLLPALVATTGSNLRLRGWLKLRRPSGVAVALGALVGGAGYLVAVAVLLAVQRVLPRAWIELFDPSKIFEGPAWERVLVAAVAVVVAPPCEEIAFRGYVQTTLALRRSPAVAIAGSAALFAAMHLDPVRFPALLVLGSVFGWLTWRAGSVWPAVAAHAANNAVTSLLFLSVAAPSEPAEPASLAWIAVVGVVGALALGALVWAYRAATAGPPPPSASVELRDPADPSIGFSAVRVPAPLRAGAAAGVALLLAILLAGAVGAGRRHRPVPSVPGVGAPGLRERRDMTGGGAPAGRGS
ncbi:MAG TPA: type II CAAX endopeptidase family protein [Anaeromyxobacter sp.]